MTARAIIETEIEKNYQKNRPVVAGSTDLLAEYDTVHHKILLMNLEHYGVEGRELALLNSFLHDRRQYTDINLKESVTITCLPCGVVQGSTLSRVLCTLYTNVFPLLQEVIRDKEIYYTVGANHYEELPAEHIVVSFVDDSNSVISAEPGEDLEQYVDSYFMLLEIY